MRGRQSEIHLSNKSGSLIQKERLRILKQLQKGIDNGTAADAGGITHAPGLITVTTGITMVIPAQVRSIMPTITLKADERFCKDLNEMAREMEVSKSELVRQAVIAYRNNLEREHLRIAMQKASYRVRRSDPDLSDELDSLVNDGLDDA